MHCVLCVQKEMNIILDTLKDITTADWAIRKGAITTVHKLLANPSIVNTDKVVFIKRLQPKLCIQVRTMNRNNWK